MVIIITFIPKVSANKPPDLKTSVQESNTLRRSTRERKPNSRHTVLNLLDYVKHMNYK